MVVVSSDSPRDCNNSGYLEFFNQEDVHLKVESLTKYDENGIQ